MKVQGYKVTLSFTLSPRDIKTISPIIRGVYLIIKDTIKKMATVGGPEEYSGALAGRHDSFIHVKALPSFTCLSCGARTHIKGYAETCLICPTCGGKLTQE